MISLNSNVPVMQEDANGVKVAGDIRICELQTDDNSTSLITFEIK